MTGMIPKELWTKEVNNPEVKTSYDYVTEQYERLDDSLKPAQEEFQKHCDKKAEPRRLEVGDQVLLLNEVDSILEMGVVRPKVLVATFWR